MVSQHFKPQGNSHPLGFYVDIPGWAAKRFKSMLCSIPVWIYACIHTTVLYLCRDTQAKHGTFTQNPAKRDKNKTNRAHMLSEPVVESCQTTINLQLLRTALCEKRKWILECHENSSRAFLDAAFPLVLPASGGGGGGCQSGQLWRTADVDLISARHL